MSKKRRKGFSAGYKGYIIHFSWNMEERVFVGTADGVTEQMTEIITVKGKHPDAAIYEFCNAIDRYLEKIK